MPRSLNEFERIDAFLEVFHRVPSPHGPGDDAALLAAPKGTVVVTTDAVVEGVHFTRRTFRFADVGHKALAVNLSDVAAMGARPTWALCALQLPEDVSTADLQQLSAGMAALATAHGVRLIGGNLTRGLQLSVTMTVAGEVPRGQRPLLRHGARAGHLVYVSGPLGSAAAGLEVLQRGQRRSGARGPVAFEARWEALVLAQRAPSPHVRWGLAAAKFASAGIDVSDGLLQDLAHLAVASKVGVALEGQAIPVLEALLRWHEREEAVLKCALTGGEDYVLCVTVPPSRARAFERAMSRLGAGAFPIGRVTQARGLTVDGRPVSGHAGFQHF